MYESKTLHAENQLTWRIVQSNAEKTSRIHLQIAMFQGIFHQWQQQHQHEAQVQAGTQPHFFGAAKFANQVIKRDKNQRPPGQWTIKRLRPESRWVIKESYCFTSLVVNTPPLAVISRTK